jgi:hypothetical protein
LANQKERDLTPADTIELQWIWNKENMRMWTGFIWQSKGQCRDFVNTAMAADSIKGWEFLNI